MKAYMTWPDWLENSNSFFSPSFVLAKESEIFSKQILQSFSSVIFEFAILELVGCFAKVIRNDQRPKVFLTPSIYKTSEENEIRNFWPVINFMRWLILYAHQNDDVLN